MSMITLNGVLLNIYKAPARGDVDEKDKIQIRRGKISHEF